MFIHSVITLQQVQSIPSTQKHISNNHIHTHMQIRFLQQKRLALS